MKGQFILLETDKRVYYPGDYIEMAVHIRLIETINRVESLSVQLKGVESFRFQAKPNSTHRSLSHKRLVVD